MKISAKRETLLEKLYGKKFVYCHDIEDKRSMNWLETNKYVFVGFSQRHLTSVCHITQKGIDYLKSRPAFN